MLLSFGNISSSCCQVLFIRRLLKHFLYRTCILVNVSKTIKPQNSIQWWLKKSKIKSSPLVTGRHLPQQLWDSSCTRWGRKHSSKLWSSNRCLWGSITSFSSSSTFIPNWNDDIKSTLLIKDNKQMKCQHAHSTEKAARQRDFSLLLQGNAPTQLSLPAEEHLH